MNRKRALIIILILLTSLFPLIPIPLAKASSITVSISNDYDDVWMTESGNVFSSVFMVMILDNEIGIHSFLRFQNLQISKTAKINYATLKIYVAESCETPDPGSVVTIYGIDEPDCSPFTSDGSLWSLSRPYTSASVNWNTTVWAGYQSVNVTDIVKEIVNQYAWNKGNDLGLQILGGSDSGQSPRSFEDYYHAYHEGQAELTIVYDVIDEEEEPPGDPDFVEQYGDYTIWSINETGEEGWAYKKNHTIDGSTAGAQTDYQVNISTYFNIPKYYTFSENGVAQPSYGIVNYPPAVYHNGITYIVWQGGDNTCDPYIRSYNHSSKTWSGIFKIGENPLTNDDHGAPSMCIDNGGYIHVFFGCHFTAGDRNIQHSISDSPLNISAWTSLPDIVSVDPTYPKPHAEGDNIWLLYRSSLGGAQATEVFQLSEDNGTTWGVAQTIILADAGDIVYAGGTEKEGNLIHIVWVRHNGAIGDRYNVYHAYLNVNDNHMYSMDGTDLGTSISTAESDNKCMAVDSGIYRTQIPPLELDASGNPYIIYITETATGFAWKFVYWMGSAWSTPTIITTDTDHIFNHADFILNSPTDIEAYLTTSGSSGRGGDIEKWDYDGVSWTVSERILSESESGRALNHPTIPLNYVESLKMIFSQFTLEYTSTDVESYAYGSDFIQGDIGEGVSLDGNCRDDFGDVRFYQGDTELKYWMEQKWNNSYADFWVKVPSIPASPNSTIIEIHYGNPDVTTTSNHTATMIKADDGVSGNFDEDTKGTATFSHVDGSYRITENSIDDAFASGMNMTDWAWMSYIRVLEPFDAGAPGGRVIFGLFDEDTISELCGLSVNVSAKQRFQILRRSSNDITHPNKVLVTYFNETGDSLHWDGDSWEETVTRHEFIGDLELRIWVNGTFIYGDVLKMGVSQFSVTPSIAISSVKNFTEGRSLVWSDPYTQAYVVPQDIDRYFTRKYASVEPTHGEWGEEQEDGGGVTYIVTDDNDTVIPTCEGITDIEDLKDCIDDYIDPGGGDPLDPTPGTQGWTTEGPFTRFKMRLYFLFVGLGCLFTPIWAMAYKKFDAVGYTWCFLIMVLGVGLLWSITGI